MLFTSFVVLSTHPLSHPLLELMVSISPSHADFSEFTDPAKLSVAVFAMSDAVDVPVMALRISSAFSAFSARIIACDANCLPAISW